IRLLLYLIKHMNYNDLTVFIDTKKVLEDLGIKKATYHLWKKKLIKEGYIEKVNPYVYKIKPYSFIKGNMKNTLENEIGLN
ncbi:MAG: replication/maintenance protein RepL, partial [Candidatus Hydrogenedens sp.]